MLASDLSISSTKVREGGAERSDAPVRSAEVTRLSNKENDRKFSWISTMIIRVKRSRRDLRIVHGFDRFGDDHEFSE